MVVLMNLDESGVDDPLDKLSRLRNSSQHITHGSNTEPEDLKSGELETSRNPNLLSTFAAALSCYPIVSSLASQLDLNSLHDLALTCRQFRANLLQFRSQLIRQALRCTNDSQSFGPKLADRFRESQQTWTGVGANGRRYEGNNSDRLTSGRVGRCARDMVGECKRCGVVVCRNCTIKQPPDKALDGRYRRLCRTCIKAPLEYHLSDIPSHPTSDADTPASTPLPAVDADPFLSTIRASSTPSTPSSTPPPSSHSYSHPPPTTTPSTTEPPTQPQPTFTHPAFTRSPCACLQIVYLCTPCGSALRTSDVTYMRGWTWRTRYSQYLGGLGTGIGEGNEGVSCGRGSSCLAAKEVEKEVDAGSAELAEIASEGASGGGKVDREGGGNGNGRQWGGTSFFTQEIEGLGGKMKKKVKKRVRVGAVVKEYEDERDCGGFLAREKGGVNRGWCAWCERVVLGNRDLGLEKRGGSVGGENGMKVKGTGVGEDEQR